MLSAAFETNGLDPMNGPCTPAGGPRNVSCPEWNHNNIGTTLFIDHSMMLLVCSRGPLSLSTSLFSRRDADPITRSRVERCDLDFLRFSSLPFAKFYRVFCDCQPNACSLHPDTHSDNSVQLKHHHIASRILRHRDHLHRIQWRLHKQCVALIYLHFDGISIDENTYSSERIIFGDYSKYN